MSSPDDGHGPKYGCTYQACANPYAPQPCPFVKDKKPAAQADEPQCVAKRTMHEFRQLVPYDRTFYCIYCLHITNGKRSD